MLKIRLRRGGATHSPFYRIVVSESTRTPRASVVEELGTYDPKREPLVFDLKQDRVDYWLGKGAKMSETVASLVRRNRQSAQA